MTFRKLDPKIDKLQARDKWIEVTKGMRGWFAVMMWVHPAENDLPMFPEPWVSGNDSFIREEDAKLEAIAWAKAENMPYII